jgi:hypothetical protein
MKKIIGLSLLSMVLLAQESISHLHMEQVNKIIDSTFSEEGVKSQGSTDIEEDAFVDNVDILQKPSVDEEIPGNLIVDTTVTNSGSEVHQGLTNVKSGAKLQDAKLESMNIIDNLKATSGESFVSQANVIAGEDSNVTKLVSSANDNIVGDGTADKFLIKEENIIEDTNIRNTTVHQGLIVLKDGADVSNLNTTQKNSIKRSDMSGQNEINATQIRQGHIKIEDGVARNITLNVENQIDNIKVNDNSVIDQAYIKSTQSDINNLNSKLNNLNTQDIIKNEINNITTDNAVIEQSVMKFKQSRVDMLDRYNRGDNVQQNNLIKISTIENNSTILQSSIELTDGSDIKNVEYFTAEDSDDEQDAINEIKNLNLADNSAVYQDRLELNSASVENSNMYRTTSIKDVNMGNESTVYQFYTKLENSKMDNTKLSNKSFIKETAIDNSDVSQSLITVQ